MKVARTTLVTIACFCLAACRSPDPGVTSPPPPEPPAPDFDLSSGGPDLGEPLANLSAEELARFEAGREEFEDVEDEAAGLGPIFNESSCAACHNGPLGGTIGRLETRFGRSNPDGTFDPMAEFGGSLIQDHAIGVVADGFEYVPEAVPAEATVRAGRITTQLFGLGLVDAVPDQELIQLARLQAVLTPATAGVPSHVTDVSTGQPRIGRFGWKAQVPTLFVFSGDAYLNEMGITNPLFPNESCPQGDCGALAHNPVPDLNDDGEGVEKFNDFMTFLAPPPRGPRTLQVVEGSLAFTVVGCANCHTPVLVTGDSPVEAIRNQAFQPFSDFLLHDMGALGDGITQNEATGRLMRTAPLWGARSRSLFLHDGRATTLEAAILAHDGQGSRARDRFAALGDRTRNALLAFLNSL